MLTLFLSLFILTGVALIIGSAVTGFLDADTVVDRPADQAILSIWVGIIILANSFFAISLVYRLSIPISMFCTAFLTLLAILTPYSRMLLIQLAKATDMKSSCGIITIGLGVAAYCSQVLVWYDSGLYHLQYIKWLSDVGIVPGMALIHWRLGISSSWFALAAPFNQGILAGRMFTLTGGFCLWMLLLQAGIAVYNLAKQQGRLQDLFMLFSTLLTLPILLIWGMPNSPTPDLPVICIVIVTAWTILTASQAPDTPHQKTCRKITLGVIILAGGAVSMKLSATPLLAVSGLFYLLYRGFSINKLLASTILSILILAPLAAAGVLITGCLFFPSTLFCPDVPWALGQSFVSEKSRIIQEWAKWGGAPAPEGATSWNWLQPWILAEPVGAAMITISLCSATAILYSSSRRASSDGVVPVTAIALSGTAFMLCTAPSWRFGLGYLVLIPALALTFFGKRAAVTVLTGLPLRLIHNPAVLGTLAATAIALHSHIIPRPSYKLLDDYFNHNPEISGDKPHFNLILPPKAQNICNKINPVIGQTVAMTRNTLLIEHAPDFIYYQPTESETCWDSPLPCAAGEDGNPPVNVVLRNKPHGISGGFVRSGKTQVHSGQEE